MSAAETLNVLNDLLAIVYRSLPMYLHDAQPWHARGKGRAADVLSGIVADQRSMAQRIANFILDRGGEPEAGVYPEEFSTANWHFVALDFLLQPLVDHQRRDVDRIALRVSRLSADREARALAEEVLGLAKGHLELLEELSGAHGSEAR
jgi:hypothetical protein